MLQMKRKHNFMKLPAIGMVAVLALALIALPGAFAIGGDDDPEDDPSLVDDTDDDEEGDDEEGDDEEGDDEEGDDEEGDDEEGDDEEGDDEEGDDEEGDDEEGDDEEGDDEEGDDEEGDDEEGDDEEGDDEEGDDEEGDDEEGDDEEGDDEEGDDEEGDDEEGDDEEGDDEEGDDEEGDDEEGDEEEGDDTDDEEGDDDDDGYRIPTLEGDGATYEMGSGETMTFRFDIDISYFDEDVTIDGDYVEPSNYTYRSGSTILEFSADYINSLGAGNHTLEVYFSDGRLGMADFTLASADTTGNSAVASPVTGDSEGDVKVPDTGYFTGENGNSAENVAIKVAVIAIAVLGVAGVMYMSRATAKSRIDFTKK